MMGEPSPTCLSVSVVRDMEVETVLAVTAAAAPVAAPEEVGMDPVGGSHRISTIRGSRPSAAAIPTAAIWG